MAPIGQSQTSLSLYPSQPRFQIVDFPVAVPQCAVVIFNLVLLAAKLVEHQRTYNPT